jgi:hypothetical protein
MMNKKIMIPEVLNEEEFRMSSSIYDESTISPANDLELTVS